MRVFVNPEDFIPRYSIKAKDKEELLTELREVMFDFNKYDVDTLFFSRIELVTENRIFQFRKVRFSIEVLKYMKMTGIANLLCELVTDKVLRSKHDNTYTGR